MQVIIEDAVEDGVQGFRGGYVSSLAVVKAVSKVGMKSPAAQSIRSVLENMGYRELGRAPCAFVQEDLLAKTIIYANERRLKIEGFGPAQGY